MREILTHAPIDIKRARRVALEIVDACGTEQDLFVALPILGQASHDVGRRAVDVGVLTAAVGRALGLTAVEVANLTVAGLLHQAGHAFENPDPATFTAPEAEGVLALRQLLDATRLTGDLARRISVSMEFALGPELKGPPYLGGVPTPLSDSQVIAAAVTWLDLVRGTKKSLPLSPLEAALKLLESPPRHIDRGLLQVFVATVGLFPVGTLVELQNDDVAVVSDIEHLRGRAVYNAATPPVAGPRRIFVERMRTAQGALIPERQARVRLGDDTPDGSDVWAIRRTLNPEGWQDVVLRGVLRRPTTVATQMGLRA